MFVGAAVFLLVILAVPKRALLANGFGDGFKGGATNSLHPKMVSDAFEWGRGVGGGQTPPLPGNKIGGRNAARSDMRISVRLKIKLNLKDF